MKVKILMIILILGGCLLFMPSSRGYAFDVFSNACGGSGTGGSAVCSGETKNDPLSGPNGVLFKVSKLIALIAGTTAVIMIMVGGLMYILSNGDASKISTAKDTIVYAAVGLIVIAVAQGIITLVVTSA